MSQVISFTDYVPAPRFDSVPWSQVIVEEGATSDGVWATIDTVTLSPVDADPTTPQPRNITVTNASDTLDLWYRLTFVDANGNTGEPSTPIQNGSTSTQFVSAAEFGTRLGITLNDGETERANALLSLASGLIQQETRQTIELVENDVLSVPSIYGERFRLPQRPVRAVSSVTLTGHQQSPVTVDPAVYYLDKDELVRITSRLIFPELQFVHWSPGWLGPYWTLTVTYTHGFTTIPEVVKTVCMEAVVRAWVNPGSVARETVGDTATVYDNNRFSPTGLLLTDDEKKNINDLLRRRSGSVTLR